MKAHHKIKKESKGKVLEMHFDEFKNVLSCLTSDNKIEFYKVIIDNDESIVKKLKKMEKRKSLKRSKD